MKIYKGMGQGCEEEEECEREMGKNNTPCQNYLVIDTGSLSSQDLTPTLGWWYDFITEHENVTVAPFHHKTKLTNINKQMCFKFS